MADSRRVVRYRGSGEVGPRIRHVTSANISETLNLIRVGGRLCNNGGFAVNILGFC